MHGKTFSTSPVRGLLTGFLSPLLCALAVLPLVHSAEYQVVEIATLPGKLRYDIEEFYVPPASEVKLIFTNNDEMQHNLLICEPSNNITMRVAQKAWALGANAMAKQYVPDMQEVLHHTRVVNPAEQDILTFTAPNTIGDYPYVCTLPGHAFTMKGIMHVTKTPPAAKIVQADREAQHQESTRFHLHPTTHPMVKRAFVENGPARSVMVGFPGGINYCFDADSCAVVFGWFGMFLDVGPDWGYNENHRGGQPVKTLGNRFDLGFSDLPVRISSPYLTPQVEFQGYHWNGSDTPEIHYLVNGIPVVQTIRPAPQGIGLEMDFEFKSQQMNAPVFIKLDNRKARIHSTAGEWTGEWLRIPHDQTRKFTVTLISKTAEN